MGSIVLPAGSRAKVLPWCIPAYEWTAQTLPTSCATTQQAPPLTVDLLGGDKEPFAQRSTRWLGERFERQKLEQLGSLLPWHEFK